MNRRSLLQRILAACGMGMGVKVEAHEVVEVPWSEIVAADGTWKWGAVSGRVWQTATSGGIEPPPFSGTGLVVHMEETEHPLNHIEGDGTWRLHKAWVREVEGGAS